MSRDVVAYVIGVFIAVLGVAYVLVALLFGSHAATAPRMAAPVVLRGAMWLLIGAALVLGEAASSRSLTVGLCASGFAARFASVVVAGRAPWRQTGSPDARRGGRART